MPRQATGLIPKPPASRQRCIRAPAALLQTRLEPITVHDIDSNSLEMTGASGQDRISRRGDAGHLAVADFQRATGVLRSAAMLPAVLVRELCR
jgi:hypothetical protein